MSERPKNIVISSLVSLRRINTNKTTFQKQRGNKKDTKFIQEKNYENDSCSLT